MSAIIPAPASITYTDGATLSASTATGFFYGLQSFLQLIPLDAPSVEIPCQRISDQPRFQWRGVLLDCARRFFPKPEILKLLDTISIYKLNRFHWHLTDDQGWRVEIKKYPELTEEGLFYTQDDILQIVAYAAERGISVVPEIEMPGHSSAILEVKPELRCVRADTSARPSVDAAGDDSSGTPSNVYCAGNEETFSVIEEILVEVFSLFPSEFVHIGGDEANKEHWKRCPKCQARMKSEGIEDVDGLQSYFVQRVESVFLEHNKRLLGWDEIMDGGLAPSAALMYWRSEEGDAQLGDRLLAAAERGHQIVMTPQTNCYFDYHQDPEWFHEPTGAIGTVTLKDAYSLEPIPHGLPEADHRNILGGQCNMWNDGKLGLSDVEYMLFPRVLALAEVVWSPPERHDYSSFIRRIPAHLRRLEAFNVKSRYPDGIEFSLESGALGLEPEFAGLRIHYTTNGDQPTGEDSVYIGPVEVSRSTLVRAAVVRDDGRLGRVKSYMAGDVIGHEVLTIVRSTDSDPAHLSTEIAGRLDWEMWVTATGIPLPHEIVFDLGSEQEIAGFIYEPRLDGSSDGNILEYEIHVSGEAGESIASSGRLSGRREKQYVIFDKSVRGRLVTFVILDAVGGVTSMWGFELIRP